MYWQLGLIYLFCCFPAIAAVVNPEPFHQVLVAEKMPLLLNGQADFQDDQGLLLYTAALYTQTRLRHYTAALRVKMPMRMALIIHRAIPAWQFRALWEKAIVNNNSPVVLKLEQIRIEQFLHMVQQDLDPGAEIQIDFLPQFGTRVVLKGNIAGVIEGEEFFDILLGAWLGPNAPSQSFRDKLLGSGIK